MSGLQHVAEAFSPFDTLTDSVTEPTVARTGDVYENLRAVTRGFLDAYIEQMGPPELCPQAFENKAIQTPEFRSTMHPQGMHPRLSELKDIRIMELHHGNPKDDLNCTLHVCSLGFDLPPAPEEGLKWNDRCAFAISRETHDLLWYTALSYVWGAPIFERPLTCNGYQTAITHNLDLALRHVRRSDSPVNLWVDQICINQDDLKEKGQQVELMSRIYRRSWVTVVWLGEEANNSSEALESMRDFNAVFQYELNASSPDADFFARNGLPVPGSQQWQDLKSLLARTWFQRVWIIQEVALSTKVEVLCGHKCVSWADISIFANHIARQDLMQHFESPGEVAGDVSETGIDRIERIDSMKEYTNTIISPDYQPGLLSNLVACRGSKATDIRDKVFAVMGIKPSVLKADYSTPASDVYIEAAKTVNSQELISLLCCVDYPEQVSGLPSWVPDWSTPRHTTTLGYLGRNHGVYRACGDPRALPEFSMVGDSLAIPGILFDKITATGQVVANSPLADLLTPLSRTSHFVTESMDLTFKHCQAYSISSTLFSAFCHTLIGGMDHTRVMRAPFDDYAPIFALLFDITTGRSPTFSDQPTFKRKLTLANLNVRQPSRIYRKMQIAFKAAVEGRRFAITSKGYMGLVPRMTEIDDCVCVFLGSHIPFVVRRKGGGEFELVGECYVHGIMDGEIVAMDLKKVNVVLV
ncbi:hypothetical protein N7G274_003270 [Stereocaulon virgatum]|uniref:Heterokaryon incompatibility domain-containing protein n=1 Tax=Stereocaulon virgatum TaxID=373712 RepID=A0ABR4AE59_9LECA